MAKSTQAFKTGFTVMKGGNVPTYTLEYLSPSKKKKTGEYETIVVPYVELGRSNKCNVQYGDESPTVSRRHAAIERKGNNYFLTQLSETNPTLVNGKPIAQEWSLNNGDEIQLSMEGPKLRFNVTPTGTASMGFTKKISLVTQQAIKPYRTVIFSLIVILIVIAAAGAWFIYQQDTELEKQAEEIAAQIAKQDSLRNEYNSRLTEMSNKNENLLTNYKQESKAHMSKIKELEDKIVDLKSIEPPPNPTEIYTTFKDNIFYLEVSEIFVTLPNGESGYMEQKWTGTAFLCEDGKLITARHCIQGWRYSPPEDADAAIINFAELNGGNVSAKFRVTSNNEWFEFDYRDVVYNDEDDYVMEQLVVEGKGKNSQEYTYYLKYAGPGASDWAYVQTNKTSNINYDKELSKNLLAGEKMYILGFSLGQGGPSEGDVKPFYSEASVAQNNLSSAGMINVSDRNFESGNSGGPVFVSSDDDLKCIGIISFIQFDSQQGLSTLGGIVPIGNIQ